MKLISHEGREAVPVAKCKLDLSAFYEDVHRFLNKRYLPKAKYVLYEYDSVSIYGYVFLEACLLLTEDADDDPVGLGRAAPNKDPPLEAPKSGRHFREMVTRIKDIQTD